MQNHSYDIAIVGAGPAGLSAALVLGRSRRRVALIDSGSPRNAPAAHMHGYLSRDGMPPSELLAAGRSEVTHYGVDIVDDVVVGIDPCFTIHLERAQPLTARRILVATGVGDGIPDLPGVEDRWGRDLLHCPYCHGWEVRDRPLGVIGSNPGSIQHAQLVRQWSDDVIYFSHIQPPSDEDAADLSARGIQVVDGEIERLVIESDRLTGVQLVTGEVVHRHAIFVRPIIAPHPGYLLAKLGCELDEMGFAVVDRAGRTTVSGVWGAGNAVDPRAQVITAAGEGSAAAIDINNDLVQDDIVLARAGQPTP